MYGSLFLFGFILRLDRTEKKKNRLTVTTLLILSRTIPSTLANKIVVVVVAWVDE